LVYDSSQMTGQDSGAPTILKTGARPTATSQRDIEKEIEAGLPNQIGRMRDAYDCLRYSMARFEEYPTRHKDMRYRSPSVRRTTRIFGRIVDILCMHLYKRQPVRKLADPVLSEWLETVYRRNYIWAKMRRLEQLTLIGGFAAIQLAGSTDPAVPIDMQVWGADQMAYWCHPDTPTKIDALATVDFYDNQRRLKLWTREEIVLYVTTKGLIHPAFGSSAFKFRERKPNPYRNREGEGIIPFAFAHWTFPVQDFETNSPGINLKELNQGVNERLDNLGDSIYFNCRPIGVAQGVDDGWAPPAEIRPGDFLKLPADNVDLGGNGPVPTLSYLMPDLSYVTVDWEDQAQFLDHTLEMWGIPPSLFRMNQSAVRSGAALITEQLPIMGWVEGRQPDWSFYEEDLAKRAIEVAESHLMNVGLTQDADILQAALDDWSFSLRWPTLFIQLPGPDRDRNDDWRLQHSQVSLIGILQERQDLTEQEALEFLQKVAQQNAQIAGLGIDPRNVEAFGMGMEGGGGGGFPPKKPGYGQPSPEDATEGEGGSRGSQADRTDFEDRTSYGGG
jgi:hypothetical protein